MLLLDTHVLLWHLEDSPRLGPLSRERITSGDIASYSAASIWELTIKSMLGKITLPDGFDAGLQSSQLKELPVQGSHARAIAEFPELTSHDPFDRLLLAQARVTGGTFLTADGVLLTLGLPFVADARN
ncbi:MAG: type II toxin-antitoxin system VapC family toxin [Actinomycetota bacterium]|nr:type II toxin-antitoxin system VapC family toxin [Actinomycetota bacterium]